jgi:hypothetical protein
MDFHDVFFSTTKGTKSYSEFPFPFFQLNMYFTIVCWFAACYYFSFPHYFPIWVVNFLKCSESSGPSAFAVYRDYTGRNFYAG